MKEERWQSEVKKAFLMLLRGVQTNQVPDSDEFRLLTADQWRELYALVKYQTMVVLLFPLVEKLPKEVLPPKSILLQWWADREHWLHFYQQKLVVGQELLDRLEAEGFQPVVMKGWAFAQYYPDPASRISGDIDLYIPNEFDRLISLLRQKKFVMNSSKHHEMINYQGIQVEFHPLLINPPVVQVPLNAESILLSGVSFRVPGREANLMVMLTHMARHLMQYGFSFRHAYDLYEFWNCCGREMDTTLLKHQLEEIGIDRLFDALMWIGEQELGVKDPFYCHPEDAKLDRLVKILQDDLFIQGDAGLIFENLRHRIADVSSPWRKMGAWINYYWYSLKRIYRLRLFWPSFAWHKLYHHTIRRVGYLLEGHPLHS